MFRTAATVLGFALLATAANAADTIQYKVSLQGKSPAQVHAAIEGAAVRVCNDAFPASQFESWSLRDIRACRAEAAQTAQAKADAYLATRGDSLAVAHGSR